MVLIIVFVLSIAFVSVIQIASFAKQGYRREKWGYLAIMVFVAIIGSLKIGDVKIPSPLRPLQILYEPIVKMLIKP